MRRAMDKGIRYSVREVVRPGRYAPQPEEQVLATQLGIVMDDQDDQRMGRLWVYVPGFRSKRFDPHSVPRYGGTTPDRQRGRLNFDTDLRAGWILCNAAYPAAGSDDFRVGQAPDGRRSPGGDVNSYGDWYQPRIGDTVGVFFVQGDPRQAYWFCCSHKYYRNGSLGMAGQPKSDVRSDGSDVTAQSGPNANIPTLDRARDANTLDDPPRIATTFAQNLMQAGLIADICRGAGTRSPRRESPSYVRRWKRVGWVYDREKYNNNIDGRQFQQNKSKYGTVNTTGHQIIMDDHPDYQSVRIRTSFGSQILFNDSCTNPYIFLNTPKGNVWVEMVDDGTVNIFAAGSVRVHSSGDINLTADRDINLEAGRNFNVLVHGNETHHTIGRTEHAYDGMVEEKFLNRLDQIINGDRSVLVQGRSGETIGGNFAQIVQQTYGCTIGGDIVFDRAADLYLQSGNNLNFIGDNQILVNQPATIPAVPTTSIAPNGPQQPAIPTPSKKPGPPTTTQINQGSPRQPGTPMAYLGRIVPQHQPWRFSCGTGNTKGTNGAVGAKTTRTAQTDNNCVQSRPQANMRLGRTNPRAQAPDPVTLPARSGGPQVVQVGQPYQTRNPAEPPQYVLGRILGPGQTHPLDQISPSPALLDFLKQQETFSPTPTLDVMGNPIIGYGTPILVGRTIGGITVTADILAQLRSNTLTTTIRLVMREAEASTALLNELTRIQPTVNRWFPQGYEMTQGQYDRMLSLARSVGPTNLSNTPEGQSIVQGMVRGQPQQVQQNWVAFRNVNGVVNCDQINRRKRELNNGVNSNRGTNPQPYTPRNPVGCGNTQLDPTVIRSVQSVRQNNPNIPCSYAVGTAGIESAFNPNAAANRADPRNGALGLYQFEPRTWTHPGIGTSDTADRTNPEDSASAFSNLTERNRTVLQNANPPIPINDTRLYIAHNLGAPAATRFYQQLNANPNATIDPNAVSGVARNPGIYRVLGRDGQYHYLTYQQAADNINNKFTRINNQYGGCFGCTTST